jgi:hypothetical protein
VAESDEMNYIYYEKMLAASGFNVVRVGSQQWFDSVAMNENAHVAVVSLSDVGNTPHAAIQLKMPIVYIVPGEPDDYRHLTGDNPNSVALAEPVDYEGLVEAMKRVVRY